MDKNDLLLLKVIAGVIGGSIVIGAFYITVKVIESACLEAISQAFSVI